MVTEDARDFGRIVQTWASRGERHAGIVFTSPRRFHRGSSNYPENLVNALTALFDSAPDDQVDWVHWLQ